jgi:Spy/CpxP family protein refolding chaperone
MKLVRSIVFSLSVVTALSIGVVACGGSVEHEPQTSATAMTKQPIGVNTHGFVKLVGEALGDVPLRAQQRTDLEKLAQDAEARHAPMLEARKDIMSTFADQVEKGTIDKAALEAKVDKATADMEKSRTDDRAAIAKMHAILDAEQRGQFVDALEGRLKAHHSANGHHGGFMHMKKLAEDLKLTDDQKTQIHAVMKESFKAAAKAHHMGHHSDQAQADKDKPAAGGGEAPAPNEWHHARMAPHGGKKALEAFRGDKLDLDTVAPPHDIKKMGKMGVEHITTTAEKILPILTADQRKIAAEKLRTMAASGDSSLIMH